jgi:ATP synthase protein I
MLPPARAALRPARTGRRSARVARRPVMAAGGRSPGDAPERGQPRKPSEADGYRILSYMVGGMGLYGAVGWLIGRWTGLPFLLPVGMIVGLAFAIMLIIFRVTRA